MQSNATRFALVVLLMSAIVMLASATADGGYEKSQLEGYMTPKPDTQEEHTSYEKPKPKLPTKPVIPKEEDGEYEKNNLKNPTKPMILKEEDEEEGEYKKTYPKTPTKPEEEDEGEGEYKKTNPKIPTKPMVPKEEDEEEGEYKKTNPKTLTKPKEEDDEEEEYKKTNPKIPTKPVVPKEEDEEEGEYKKTNPKMPTKPMIPKEQHEGYEKTNPKLPTKPMAPKDQEHDAYEKGYTKVPTKPVMPKEEHEADEKTTIPKLPKQHVMPKMDHGSYEKNYPKIPSTEMPLVPKVLQHPKNIAVQGLIYCKYGSKLLPLQGATARITCLAVHKNGYESAPFSLSSCPADEKGYFLAKIPSSTLIKDDLWEITECKAFLENSPWASCKVAENTNGGLTGARVTFSRHLKRDGYCLSSVGPFIFNPGQESLPKEGY